MGFAIERGTRPTAQKVVVYGPEGIGKSTFASQFPDPVFIDTEGSTKHMDVGRLPRPTSWKMLQEEILYARTDRICQTLVIDTADWAEQLCVEAVCSKHGKAGIEDFGYGNGYVYVKEEFARFLDRLTDVTESGIHVVLNAHAQIRKFEQPDESGAYDRYELKLGKKTQSQTSPLVKEWADMLLFANYKTLSVAVDDQGKKHKAKGGRRVMYTAHHPCWDAKNRHGLAEELPFEYTAIAHCIPILAEGQPPTPEARKMPETVQEDPAGETVPKGARFLSKPEGEPEGASSVRAGKAPEMPEKEPVDADDRNRTMKALFDLMEKDGINRLQIQKAVAAKGYYPETTLLENYDIGFIQGVLIGAWDQIVWFILNEEVPF